MTKQPHRILLVFVDGLGLGARGDRNPLADSSLQTLPDLLAAAVPIDACLGVPGHPQSATGQTTLLTGVNAARRMGRHVEGFPGPALRRIIREHNIFAQLAGRGIESTFANAYWFDDSDGVRAMSMHSVTTVAALSAFGSVRCRTELEAGRAVYQDLTRAQLRRRGYEGQLLTPEQSAEHLAAIAADHGLTLFEYFQTDRAGHSGDRAAVLQVLGVLDRFMGRLQALAPAAGLTLLLTSDHGNIEDVSTPRHTRNPVPLFAAGPGAEAIREQTTSLADVTPSILATLAP